MQRIRRHPVLSPLIGLALIVFLVFAGTGIYVASVAGDLPWQTDPTRIAESITPFADQGVPTVFVPGKATETPTP